MSSPPHSGATPMVATASGGGTAAVARHLPARLQPARHQSAARVRAFSALMLATAALALVTASPAQADTTATGSGGQRLTVSKSTGVSRAGETVTVSGTGYDTSKGIYVGFCVDNGAASAPSPCGGGADMSGAGGNSHWISSNPPSYGVGLAVPYGSGGSFRVSIPLATTIGDVDCTVRVCSVVTRADHTRTSDRSQDVRIPNQFAAAATPPAPGTAATRRPTAGSPDTAGTSATTSSGGTTEPGAPTVPGDADDATPSTVPNDTTGADGTGTGTGTGQHGGTSTGTGANDLAVTRVSSVGAAGRWWSGTLVLLALGVIASLVLSAARRRRTDRSRP